MGAETLLDQGGSKHPCHPLSASMFRDTFMTPQGKIANKVILIQIYYKAIVI